MSVLKLKYEILVSGIYPFGKEFSKNGFELTEKIINEKKFQDAVDSGSIYLSPYMAYCCYKSKEDTVYLTFQKETTIEIDYGDMEEYDLSFTNEHLNNMDLFKEINDLEKIMVLEVNNDIKFPVKIIRVFDENDNPITVLGNVSQINIPSLLSNDQKTALERIERQNNRLGFGVSYEKIIELKNNNKYFDNALAMYYSSFSVSDESIGFTLLVTALEALLSLSTYSETENCDSCGQTKYKIRSTVSENVSLILMDEDDSIKSRIKKLYDKRSKLLHTGTRDITNQDEQELQEYVRKVLLMYWYSSMDIKSFEHKLIIQEIRSKKYYQDLMYKNFLTGLSNAPFEVIKYKMLNNVFDTFLSSNNKNSEE